LGEVSPALVGLGKPVIPAKCPSAVIADERKGLFPPAILALHVREAPMESDESDLAQFFNVAESDDQ